MWLIWWAWSQYTWAGNAVDLDRRSTRIWMLLATGAMLVAAAAIPDAFGNQGQWFAIPYTVVRRLGLALYWFGLRDDPTHRAALRTYLPIALISPLLILVGGSVGGTARVVLWSLAILIDIASVAAAGRGEFNVDPAHFAERHGLIVIVALGESVIATGATATDVGLLHPTAPLDNFAVTALAAGPALYLSGFVIGNLRATGRILHARLVGLIAVVALAVIAGPRTSALTSTAAVAAVVIAIAAVETRDRPMPRPASESFAKDAG